MDEMRVKLSTKLMRGIVAKLISTAIYAKFGYKVDVQIDELDVQMLDGDTTAAANVKVHLASDEFNKIVKTIM